MNVNPILLEVFKNRFAAISEEMGVTLTRTGFSPNINLPDITLVAPIFAGGDNPAFYVANRAHHADVGGMAAGSMPLSTSLYQEGVIIPPLKIVRNGLVDDGIMDLILNNVRTPVEREGDFAAQIMANRTGVRRLEELLAKYGSKTVAFYAEAIMDYAERITRNTIADIPDGTYRFVDHMDGDGLGSGPIRIETVLNVSGETAHLDFTGSGDQVRGSVNAVRSITLSAVLYVFRCLIGRDIPTNGGILRPIEVTTRKGSILDARFPAAVAGGNVETSQRVVDTVLGALAQALPEHIPAAGQGTMNNVTIGGTDERTGLPFAYYETLAGGMGAGSFGPGESGVHSHMTNTLNTPVEALEYSYPFQVTEYSIRKGSGGEGKHRGGNGMVREITLLSDCEITVLSERRETAPWGLAGGKPGRPGRNVVISGQEKQEMPGKFNRSLKKGDTVRIEPPGGGGWGRK